MALTIARDGIRASRRFHSRLIFSLMRAPSAFYEQTPLGRVMNLCTNDLSTLDLVLPFSVRSLTNALLKTATSLIVASTVGWFLLLLSIPLVVASVVFQVPDFERKYSFYRLSLFIDFISLLAS